MNKAVVDVVVVVEHTHTSYHGLSVRSLGFSPFWMAGRKESSGTGLLRHQKTLTHEFRLLHRLPVLTVKTVLSLFLPRRTCATFNMPKSIFLLTNKTTKYS